MAKKNIMAVLYIKERKTGVIRMIMIKKLVNKTMSLLPYLIFILIIVDAITVIFSFSAGINYYDVYDYIEDVTWAEASIKANAIVNKEYIYYYLLPFGPNLIMYPFVKFFGFTFLANQMGMIVYLAIYIMVIWRLSTCLYDKLPEKLIFCSLASFFIFTYIGDNLFHHILIYGIGFVCFVGELACIIQINNNNKKPFNYFLLIIFSLWSASNGIAGTALSSFPILLSLLFVGYKDYMNKKEINISPFVVIMLPSIIGLSVFNYFNSTVLTLHQDENRMILDSAASLVKRINNTLLFDYLQIFYYHPDQESLFSAGGIWELVKLGFSLLVLIIPFFKKIKIEEGIHSNKQNKDSQIIYCACVIVMAVSLAQYLLVTSSVQRYLFNGILSLFMIDSLIIVNYYKSGKSHCIPLLLLLVLSLFTFKTLFYTYPAGLTVKEKYEKVESILKENNMNYGYVLDRRWKIVELISKGKNRNTPIFYDKAKHKYYVRNDRAYLSERLKPEAIDHFYIISDQESKDKWEIELLEKAIKKTRYEEYMIYVFDIEAWDEMFFIKEY